MSLSLSLSCVYLNRLIILMLCLQSMLSLAKLSAFAAADSDLSTQVESINTELTVIDYQEQLSEHLLLAFGYDVENQKVLKIEEIINVSCALIVRSLNHC